MNVPVSELIVRYMERLGIEYIFGMPGAHILPVYDALYASSVQTVLAKHEQGAAFMAGGYARASGKIGACIATAGPGATNLVTGIANAYVDKQPILVVTGETPTDLFGKGGLQESSGEGGSIDQGALFKGITKYNRIVERSDYLANVLNRASSVLLAAAPGPVLLSLPYNVQRETVDDALLDGVMSARHAYALHGSDGQGVTALAELIRSAQRPVIVAGYGCIRAGAQAQVAALSERLGIPVASSLKAKGVIGERSALSLGSLGVTSSGHAYRYIVEQADLVVFLGASFNERTSYVWDTTLLEGKRVAQVDNDPQQLEKVFKADVAIAGDIRDVLNGVLARFAAEGPRQDCRSEVAEEGQRALNAASASGYSMFKSSFVVVERFFAKLEQRFPEGIQIFDDNIIFAQNFFKVSSGNRYYPNSGISSLGHAIPAAIGARFADELPTFAILGDGGFQMCCMELMTAVNYGRPLTVILFNNATMGLIRKNQTQHYGKRFISCDFANPDYGLLAASFGIQHRRVENAADLDAVFDEVDFAGATNLIEIVLDKNAFPNYSSRR